jgi:ABC-type branched-subunit amino acid transport system ATPase component
VVDREAGPPGGEDLGAAHEQLLGSNGAGRTTTVRILATLLKADAGSANVHGFDVATQAANVRESISLTGRFAAVDEILSGRENLAGGVLLDVAGPAPPDLPHAVVTTTVTTRAGE